MFDLNKFYPLYFLVKHLGTCSLREVVFQNNLIPFSPRMKGVAFSLGEKATPLLLKGKGNLLPSLWGKTKLNPLFLKGEKQLSLPMASSLKKLFKGYFFIHFIYGRKKEFEKRIKP